MTLIGKSTIPVRSLPHTILVALLIHASIARVDAAAKPHGATVRTPNIILIHADDLAYQGLGCYGQKLIQTPRIDQMAAEGIRFTDFYAASAACVPSRTGMITGQHPGHAAIRDNYPPHAAIEQENGGGYLKDFPEELWPPKVPTLGRVIKDAGYHTAQFGKLEAGIPMAAGKMTEHGWDHWIGFPRNVDPTSNWINGCIPRSRTVTGSPLDKCNAKPWSKLSTYGVGFVNMMVLLRI